MGEGGVAARECACKILANVREGKSHHRKNTVQGVKVKAGERETTDRPGERLEGERIYSCDHSSPTARHETFSKPSTFAKFNPLVEVVQNDDAAGRLEIKVKAKESLRGNFLWRSFAFDTKEELDSFVKAVKASADSFSMTMKFNQT